METRAQKRKREIENSEIAKSSANNIKSRKIRQLSIKLVRLTPAQLLDATITNKIDQQKLGTQNKSQNASAEKKTTAQLLDPTTTNKIDRQTLGTQNKSQNASAEKKTNKQANSSEARSKRDSSSKNGAIRKQPLRQAKRHSLIIPAKNDVSAKKKNPITRKDGKKKLEERIKNDAPVNQYIEGEIILGTIPGFAPWPARIQKIIDETIYIEFFGTGEVNPVRIKSIQRFEINKAIPLLNRRGYKKAIRELELTLGMPADLSIFRNVDFDIK